MPMAFIMSIRVSTCLGSTLGVNRNCSHRLASATWLTSFEQVDRVPLSSSCPQAVPSAAARPGTWSWSLWFWCKPLVPVWVYWTLKKKKARNGNYYLNRHRIWQPEACQQQVFSEILPSAKVSSFIGHVPCSVGRLTWGCVRSYSNLLFARILSSCS